MTPSQQATAKYLPSMGYHASHKGRLYTHVEGNRSNNLYMHDNGLIELHAHVGTYRVEKSATRLFHAPQTKAQMLHMLDWFNSPERKTLTPQGDVLHNPNAEHDIALLIEMQNPK